MTIPDFRKAAILALVNAAQQVILKPTEVVDLDILRVALWTNTGILHALNILRECMNETVERLHRV